ncbi:MAG: hypothetical protein QM504_02790 [Pseudomonadota bacterium]
MDIKNYKGISFVIVVSLLISGCVSAPRLKQADEIVAPEPIYGNSGKFMSPYTEDEVLAEWVDKAVNAKAGAQIGAAVGAYAGAKALEMVPFFGGMMGKYAGEAIGRQIAITASGGMEYITSTSDLSFNSLDDMSVYLYVKFSTHDHYQDALSATMEIYPELKQVYQAALYKASAAAPDPEQVAKIKQQREQQRLDEEQSDMQAGMSLEDRIDETKPTVILLQENNNITEQQAIESDTVKEAEHADENKTAIIKDEEVVKSSTQAEQNNALEVNNEVIGIKEDVLEIKNSSDSDEEKVEVETKTDVNESVNRSERSGSYATTTSKFTTVTTVTTVTTPEKRTIIYKEVKQ